MSPRTEAMYKKVSNLLCHTPSVDGEIKSNFDINGYKNVLSIQCQDYYKEFVLI